MVFSDVAVHGDGDAYDASGNSTVVINGVTIIGDGNWANVAAHDASHMYSSNLFNLVDEFWDPESKAMVLNFEDNILQGCVITHQGKIINETIKQLRQ